MKSLRAGCDDGMNMISHGQAGLMVTPRILREVERETRNGRRKGSSEFSLFIDKNDFNFVRNNSHAQ